MKKSEPLLKAMKRAHLHSHNETTMRTLCDSLNDVSNLISMYEFLNADGYRNAVVAPYTHPIQGTDNILADLNIRLAKEMRMLKLQYRGVFKWNVHHEMIIFELTGIGAMDRKDSELIDVLSI